MPTISQTYDIQYNTPPSCYTHIHTIPWLDVILCSSMLSLVLVMMAIANILMKRPMDDTCEWGIRSYRYSYSNNVFYSSWYFKRYTSFKIHLRVRACIISLTWVNSFFCVKWLDRYLTLSMTCCRPRLHVDWCGATTFNTTSQHSDTMDDNSVPEEHGQ